MTENCNDRSPLKRDGTSQAQRTLAALLPSYAPVDGRSLEDLTEFAKKYAEEIRFIPENNNINSTEDWVDFFEKSVRDDQRTTAHYALFIAFLRLFENLQEDINEISARHLDFYYRDVLQLKENPEVPDQVAVIFELARKVSSAQVDEGTLLKAGKDETDVELQYATEDQLIVNRATVSDLKALYFDRGVNTTPGRPNNKIYASPVANSANGQGAEIETDPKSWRTFGYIEPIGGGNFDRPQGEIGWAFASPVLRMAEGERKITITINLEASSILLPIATEADTILDDLFNISISGAEEWIVPTDIDIITTQEQIVIKATVGEDLAAVTDYDAEVLSDPFVTDFPVVRITLNNEKPGPYFYQYLAKRVVSDATIEVDVSKVRNIIAQNDVSLFDSSKPYQPFGNAPKLGSRFYVGSQEVFSKKLTELTMNITWSGLPENFQSYYSVYNDAGGVQRNNNSFKTRVEVLNGKQWSGAEIPDEDALKDLFSEEANTTNLSNKTSINVLDDIDASTSTAELTKIGRDIDLKPFTRFDNSTQRGFLRMTLRGTDFGHGEYSNLLTTKVIDLANGETGTELPNTPYIPEIESLELTYKSSETLVLNSLNANLVETAYENRIEQFFHIAPFGVAENHPFNVQNNVYLVSGANANVYLLPQYQQEGNLYIGLADVTAPSTISMLFQVAEGSNSTEVRPETPRFSYLRQNQWVEFADTAIPENSTNKLLNSGIIKFDLPADATDDNTILPGGLHWIRLSVLKNAEATCELIEVKAQAVIAEFVDNDNDPKHLAEPLAAESISKLVESNAKIKAVTQPFASFGGKQAEASETFYTRVSARLRHKQRGITIWDYENLILQQFPEIYKAKCLSHTRYLGTLANYSENAPGHVSVIIVSNVRNVNSANPLQPRTSITKLEEIQNFLLPITSPGIDLHVWNPIFEEVKVDFHVKFFDGLDKGFYENKLNEDIVGFLSPWAFSEGEDVSFGGSIHQSTILNFIEERSYVDYVTCFKLYVFEPAETPLFPGQLEEKKVIEATANTSASILVSVAEHAIKVLEVTEDISEQDNCDECDDNIVVISTPASLEECFCEDDSTVDCGDGIGVMIVKGDGKPFRIG